MIDRAVTRITKQPRRRWPRSDQNHPSSVSSSSRRSAPIKDRSSPTRSPKSCLGSRSRSSNDPIKRKARGTEHHAPVSEVAGCCGTRAGASAGNIEFSLTMPTSGTSTTCTHEHIGNRSDASPEKGLAFASKESMCQREAHASPCNPFASAIAFDPGLVSVRGPDWPDP